MNCIITTGVAVRADANGSETFPERTRARKLSALSCLHSLLIEKKYSGIRGRALIASKAIVSLPASFSTLPSVDCSVYYSTDLFAPVETHVDYLLFEAFVDRSICFVDSSPFKKRERGIVSISFRKKRRRRRNAFKAIFERNRRDQTILNNDNPFRICNFL